MPQWQGICPKYVAAAGIVFAGGPFHERHREPASWCKNCRLGPVVLPPNRRTAVMNRHYGPTRALSLRDLAVKPAAPVSLPLPLHLPLQLGLP